MWKSKLSLKKPANNSMNSNNSMDLSGLSSSFDMETGTSEIEQSANSILDLLEPSSQRGSNLFIIQSDGNQEKTSTSTSTNKEQGCSSFELNLDLTQPQTTNDWGMDLKLREISELFEQRHYIATLLYSMKNYSAPRNNSQPKFLHTMVDFHPYYGSPQAKEFFVSKLAAIRTEAQNFVKQKIEETCKEFITLKTKETETKRSAARNLVKEIEPAKFSLADFERRASEIALEWSEKYKSAKIDIDTKAKTHVPKEDTHGSNKRPKSGFGAKRVKRA